MKRIFICVACAVALLFGVAIAEEVTIVASGNMGFSDWTLDRSGELKIFGDGPMKIIDDYFRSPWYSYRESIKSIVVEDGITTISDYAFYECKNMSSIAIADSVGEIGKYAFSGCSGLQSIDLPKNITTICESTFSHCNNLIRVTIPVGVAHIDRGAFSACESLINIDIPEGVTNIGECAFEWCSNLKSITIPNSVVDMGGYAFYQCQNLEKIKLSDSMTSICEATFFGCDSLKSIVIPKKITYIGKMAFRNSNNITSITFLGNNMPFIGENALPSTFTFIPRRSTIYCLEGSEIDNWATEEGYNVKYIEEHKHSIVIDDGVHATHITTGLTEGSHCSECGEIIIPQDIIEVVEVEKVVLPAELKVIEPEAFAEDTFVCIVLSENCNTIGARAFKNCTQLCFVEIPASVTSIDNSAFDGCDCELIIVTTSGSEAERFANEHNITCVLNK